MGNQKNKENDLKDERFHLMTVLNNDSKKIIAYMGVDNNGSVRASIGSGSMKNAIESDTIGVNASSLSESKNVDELFRSALGDLMSDYKHDTNYPVLVVKNSAELVKNELVFKSKGLKIKEFIKELSGKNEELAKTLERISKNSGGNQKRQKRQNI